jgi:exodeoxyribonuclease VII small subunit
MAEEKFNFKDAFQELEEINEWFQREDIDLDQALQKYERGIELMKINLKKSRKNTKSKNNIG